MYDALPQIERGDLDGAREIFSRAAPRGDDVASDEQGAGDDGNPVKFTRFSDIEDEPLRWLIEGRVPLAALTLLVGEPEQGKSLITLDWAARMTRGTLAGELQGKPADVALATAEDHFRFVVRPRLRAADADVKRVHAITVRRDEIDGELSIPSDIEDLRSRIEAVDAKGLYIDPVIAHIDDKIDSHHPQKIQKVLSALRRLAEERELAIVGIVHLNRRECADVLKRIASSHRFGAAARAVLLAGTDPHGADDHDKLLVHGKGNLGPRMPGLRYRIEPCTVETAKGPTDVARIVWQGEDEKTTAQDLLSVDEARNEAKESTAVRVLREALARGPIAALEAKNALRAAGVCNDAEAERNACCASSRTRSRCAAAGCGRYPNTQQSAKSLDTLLPLQTLRILRILQILRRV
jgi:hypothetical protein